MARITVEDCIDKSPNRFALVILAVHRARSLANGAQITIDGENDKNAVIALREIAEETVAPGDVREEFIHAMQQNAEIDEPESTAVPTWPHRKITSRDFMVADPHFLARGSPKISTCVGLIKNTLIAAG